MMMMMHCDVATRRPADRRFALTDWRARLGTGLLLTATLAVMSPPAALAQATAGAAATYLSDRAWTSMTNGWGPVENDRSNGEEAGGDGAPLTLNKVTYPKGLGAHAPSDLRFALNGACTSLMADVGVDDEKGTAGSVVFQVWTDGVKKYESGIMTGSMPGESITVSVLGTTELALIVADGGDGTWSDHGDWANARVSCGGDTVPAVTVASPRPAPGTSRSPARPTVAFPEAMNAATLTPARAQAGERVGGSTTLAFRFPTMRMPTTRPNAPPIPAPINWARMSLAVA